MINKGDPISPKNLVSLITTRFNTILSSVVNYIPLGFNELYSIVGTKSFSIRPKVSNPVYSARSGSVQYEYLADTNQPNIGVSYYGTPWTQELANNFGISNNFDYNLGSRKESFVKYTNKLPINPATDIVGGVPLRGNSPFIFNGFLGMSNNFEDQNIRLYIDTEGTSINVKAKQVSVLSRGTNYSITTDLLSSESDRYNLETITLNDIDLSINKSVSLISNNDYIVSVIHVPSTGSSALDLQLISEFEKEDYYPVITHSSYTIDRYTRPLFLTHYNSNGVFEVGNIDAWGEQESGTNGDSKFTKIYQESSGDDTTLSIQTIDEDRRVVPAWYYLDNDNSFIVEKTNYSGLIRHIPGAGASKVSIKRLSNGNSNSYTEDDNFIEISIGTIELTDGINSLWLNDIKVSVTQETIHSSRTPYGCATNRGLYLWLVADTSSIHNSYSSKNIRLKLIPSPFPVWDDGLDGNLGVSSAIYRSGSALYDISDYTYRCRLGFLPTYRDTSTYMTIGTAEPFESYDGEYYFPNNTWYSSKGIMCLASGSTSAILDQTTIYNLPQYGITGTSTTNNSGTGLACTYILNQIVNTTGTVVGDAIATGTGGQYAYLYTNIDTDYRLGLSVFNKEGKLTTTVSNFKVALLDNRTNLYYTGTGADGGSGWDYRLKSSWLKGFYLPCDWR